MDFIAIDVETANADMSSICALGLVHFRNGEVFRNLSTLIDPQDHFDPVNIGIHHIRPQDVIGKPTIAVAYSAIAANLTDCILVHHTAFDRVAFHRVAEKHCFQELECAWLDSARVARRAWSECSRRGYGLTDLAKKFQIVFRHHDAAEDARCAGMILLRAVADTGIAVEGWFQELQERYPERIACDGNPDGPLFGEVICFTGSLSIDRARAAKLAADAGCEVVASVSRRTTILVVGEQDVRLLNGATKSSKHRKAEELIGEGLPIKIISEQDFITLLRMKLNEGLATCRPSQTTGGFAGHDRSY